MEHFSPSTRPKSALAVPAALLLLLSATSAEVAKATEASSSVPQVRSYKVEENIIDPVTSFSVSKDGQAAGRVEKSVVSWTATFTYRAKGECVAVGSRAFISWGAKISIESCDGTDIATLYEHVSTTAFSGGIYTKYTIGLPDGTSYASSEKSEFMSTNIRVTAIGDGRSLALAHRPAWNPTGDSWSLSISDTGLPDSVYVLMVAFKTDADNLREEEQRKREEDERRREEEEEEEERSRCEEDKRRAERDGDEWGAGAFCW